VTRLKIPKTFNARNAQQRRELAVVLRDRTRDLPGLGTAEPTSRGPATEEPEIERLRAQIRTHPCHACPDREQHARWAERYIKLERETNTLRRRIEQRTNTIAREFDRVCEVLEELGYLVGDMVTPAGGTLSRIYSELDLLAAECLRRGTWAGLEAPALAAVLSALVFESRKPDEFQRPRVPGGAVRTTLEAMTHLWAELDAVERAHGVSFLREPDLGFAWAAYRWAGGADLDDVLDDVDLAAGDLVRWVKQVLDVADQIGVATTDNALRRTVRELVAAMRRGVVAFSGDID
jgi:ATP-dependent RNA helicase HelY